MKRAATIAAQTIVALAVIVGVCGIAWSQKPTAPARPATAASFKVVLIDASKAEKPFTDPKLAHMKGHLRPFSGKYNRFVLVTTQVLQLKEKQRGSVPIPGRGDFAITFLDWSGGKVRRARYQVELPKPRTKMTRRVAPNGQTLDVIPSGGKLTIVSTTVMR